MEKLFTDDYTSFRGVTHQLYIELRLTDKGLAQHREVSAIVFAFIDFIKEHLQNVDTIDLFEEVKRIS